jgi:hypothetical protein
VIENNETERLESALEGVDAGRRDALRQMVKTAAFVVPVVVSFAIDGMTVSPALAVGLNGS